MKSDFTYQVTCCIGNYWPDFKHILIFLSNMCKAFWEPVLGEHSLHNTKSQSGKGYLSSRHPLHSQPCLCGRARDLFPLMPRLVRLWPQSHQPPLPKEGLSHLQSPGHFCPRCLGEALESPSRWFPLEPLRGEALGSPGCSEAPYAIQGLLTSPLHLVIWPLSSSTCASFSQLPFPLPPGSGQARSWDTQYWLKLFCEVIKAMWFSCNILWEASLQKTISKCLSTSSFVPKFSPLVFWNHLGQG